MTEDEYDELLEALLAYHDGPDSVFWLDGEVFTKNDMLYHAYSCGRSRAIAEFQHRGVTGDYSVVYSSFNDYTSDDDPWFHEGFVSGLVTCFDGYRRFVDGD